MGDCTKKFWNKGIFIPGCPPGEPHLQWAIVDRVNVNSDLLEKRISEGRQSWDIDRMAFREYQRKLREESIGEDREND